MEGSVSHFASGYDRDEVLELTESDFESDMISSKATEGLYIYHLLCRWQDVVTFLTMTTWRPGPWIFSPPEPAGACFVLGVWSLQRFQTFVLIGE